MTVVFLNYYIQYYLCNIVTYSINQSTNCLFSKFLNELEENVFPFKRNLSLSFGLTDVVSPSLCSALTPIVHLANNCYFQKTRFPVCS